MKMLTSIVCKDKLHADGVEKRLESLGWKSDRYDDRRFTIVAEINSEFTQLLTDGCAYTDSHESGVLVINQDQLDSFFDKHPEEK